MSSLSFGIADSAKPWTAAPATQISFTGGAWTGNNTANYSFSGISIGAANASRIVAVSVYANGVANGLPNSVTINGSAATLAVGKHDPTSGVYTVNGIYYLAVPTGTTATIGVNLPDEGSRCAAYCYRIIPGYSAVPRYTNAEIASTINLNEIVGGATIYIFDRYANTAYTASRNGSALTPDVSNDFSGPDIVKMGHLAITGSPNFLSTSTYSADFNSGVITAAHWR